MFFNWQDFMRVKNKPVHFHFYCPPLKEQQIIYCHCNAVEKTMMLLQMFSSLSAKNWRYYRIDLGSWSDETRIEAAFSVRAASKTII
jgi:hypothetical protein